MTHPMVDQLRFARSEFLRGLEGLTDEEARRRFMPMNCISWSIGHLARQEQRYWLEQLYWLDSAPDRLLLPEIAEQFGSGAPASTPPLAETLRAWEAITQAADPWLDTLTTGSLAELHPFEYKGKTYTYTYGTMMLRMIYHYWYHNGENQAIRQQLGHTGLPDFVGNIDDEAPYRPE